MFLIELVTYHHRRGGNCGYTTEVAQFCCIKMPYHEATLGRARIASLITDLQATESNSSGENGCSEGWSL